MLTLPFAQLPMCGFKLIAIHALANTVTHPNYSCMLDFSSANVSCLTVPDWIAGASHLVNSAVFCSCDLDNAQVILSQIAAF